MRSISPLLICAMFCGGAAPPSAAEPKGVIPFDFVSKFDGGRYGAKIGEMIWTKLDRQGGFTIPETMLDVRDTCRSKKLHPSPQLSPEEMREIVEDHFGAHVGIFGSVELAEGHQRDVYDLVIKCVDFSSPSQPTANVVYQCRARTKTVSEIPHLYVKQLLDALYDRRPSEPPPLDDLAQRNWEQNANLVAGDFEQGSKGIPQGWDATGAQPREPLGNKVRWTTETDYPNNKVIRFSFDKATGDKYGVMYYSDPFPVEGGANYRFACRWRSDGPGVKVFIKCYAELGTPQQGESQAGGAGSGRTNRLREVYRSQQNIAGEKNRWNTHSGDFTPEHARFTPRWGRVMLYAYTGAGVVEFDDVVVKQIVPATPKATVEK